MTSQIALPTGSYADNDLRASGKRLVNCFSEINAQTAPPDSKSQVPPITIRRAPGITPFAQVDVPGTLTIDMTASAVGAIDISMTAGQGAPVPGFGTFTMVAAQTGSFDINGGYSTAPPFEYGFGTLVSGGGVGGLLLGEMIISGTSGAVNFGLCALVSEFPTNPFLTRTAWWSELSWVDRDSNPASVLQSAGSFTTAASSGYWYANWDYSSGAGAGITPGDTYIVTVTGGVAGTNGAIGYDDGVTDSATPYGSVVSNTFGSIGTLNAFFTSNATNNSVTLIVTGPSSAPAQNAIATATYTGNRGLTTLETSAATYSTSGKVSTWVWSDEPSGTPNSDIDVDDTYALVFIPEGGLPVGFDDGTTDMETPYGSVASNSLGVVGTVNRFSTSNASGNDITLVITGASAAPAKESFTSVAYTGNRGAITLATSTATYSTSGDAATWVWDNEPSGSADPDFNASTLYPLVFTSTEYAGPPANLAVRGFRTMAGITYVVIGPSLYTLAADRTLTLLATGILGSGFVRLADNTACLVILIPGTSLAYTYTIPSTYAFDIGPGIDPSDAYGRSGFGSSEVGSAVTPALNTSFGSETTTTLFGTVVALYWRYNGTQTQTVFAVDSGAAESPPLQNAFVTVSYTDTNGNPVTLDSATAIFTTSGSIGIWTWLTSGDADGLMTDSFVVTAAQDTHYATRFGYGNSTNGSLASPSIATTFGSVAVNTLFGTVAELGWYYDSGSDLTTIQFIAKGASSAPAATAFVALQYTDANNAGVFLASSEASYSHSGDYASWVWSFGGEADGIMTAGDAYNVYVSVPGASISVSAPSPNGFQQLTNPVFTSYGAIDLWFDDGYIVFLMANGAGFFNDDGQEDSGQSQITFNTSAVFLREFGTDRFVGGEVNHRIAWFFGHLTSEGYYNAGNPVGSPFSAAPDTFMEIGAHPDCAYCIANQDQSILWIANDRTVRRLNGQTPVRVSNSGIEAILENADLTGAYCLTPSVAGHPWVVWNLPAEQRSVAFDCLTTEWWEPESQDTGGNWRPLSWYNAYGLQLVGDSLTSQIGYMDTTTYTEFGDPMYMQFTTQSIYDADNRITHRRLELVATAGQAPTLGYAPLVTLWVSDDSGYTWYARETKSLGFRGQRTSRAFWTNLGQSRNRTYRFQLSDPTPSFTVQIFAELDGGKW